LLKLAPEFESFSPWTDKELAMYPNLKIAIFKKGLQQNRLSKIVGINEANLSKIIHGYREPSRSQKQTLAAFLEADENWLFEKYEGGGESARLAVQPGTTERE
jgi:transcriptional regulator with XRE-family HTH domain